MPVFTRAMQHEEERALSPTSFNTQQREALKKTFLKEQRSNEAEPDNQV